MLNLLLVLPLPSDVLKKLEKLNGMLTEITGLLKTGDYDAFKAKYTEAMALYNSICDLLPESLQGVYDMVLKFATLENFEDIAACMKHMTGSKAGFDLYVIKENNGGKVNITSVTEDGFGDRYNHGLRVFAATNDYMAIGTANPFLGTQIWRMKASQPKAPYQIIEGNGANVEQGVEAVFASDAPAEKFWRVELDGQELAAKDYAVASGSTVVTLKGKLTANLTLGKHTLTIVSTDGSATGSFNVVPIGLADLPQTGDNANLMLWAAVLLGGSAALAVVLRRKQRS